MEVERVYLVLMYCVPIIDGLYICTESPEYGTSLHGYILL